MKHFIFLTLIFVLPAIVCGQDNETDEGERTELKQDTLHEYLNQLILSSIKPSKIGLPFILSQNNPYSELLSKHKRIPAMPFLFHADVNLSLPIFFRRKDRDVVRWVFEPSMRTLIRQYGKHVKVFQEGQEYGSFPVLTPSYMPSLKLTLITGDDLAIVDKSDNTKLKHKYMFYSLYAYHHSNGQSGKSIDPDVLVTKELGQKYNLSSGNFGDNVRFALTLSFGKTITKQYEKPHTYKYSNTKINSLTAERVNTEINKEIDKSYTKAFGWLVKATKYPFRHNRNFKSNVSHLFEVTLDYMPKSLGDKIIIDAGDYYRNKFSFTYTNTFSQKFVLFDEKTNPYNESRENFRFIFKTDVLVNNGKRVFKPIPNISATLIGRIGHTMNVGYFIEGGYWSQDEYNIYFPFEYSYLKIGFATNMASHGKVFSR